MKSTFYTLIRIRILPEEIKPKQRIKILQVKVDPSKGTNTPASFYFICFLSHFNTIMKLWLYLRMLRALLQEVQIRRLTVKRLISYFW